MNAAAIRILYMMPGFSSTEVIIMKKLVQNGFDTHLLYTRPIEGKDEVLNKLESYWIDLSRFRYLPKPLRWAVFGSEIIRYIRKVKPDVILAQGIQAHGLLAVLSGVRPILLMPWGSDWAITAHRNLLMRLVSKYVVNRCDFVQIDCEVGKRTLLEISGGNIRPEHVWVFPQGIELDIFQPQREGRDVLRAQLGWADKKILIMTRQLKPVYGIDVFLKALAMAVRTDGDIRAVIVGEGPLETDLKQLSSSLGLEGIVKFVGRLDRRVLVSYLNAADIYVSTSHSDGTSLSLLEGMAVGLPVIVTDVPANLEWIKDGYNGFVAKRGNSASVNEALLKIVGSEELCRRFGERSIQIVRERADWDRNFDQFVKMFRILVSRSKHLPVPRASDISIERQ
jgi:glycosyltransferase involved in cell wall biosynthesis